MYQRILVAVDGSETSDAALAEAIRLANHVPGASVRVVAIVDVPAAALTGEGADEAAIERPLLAAARQVLAAAATTARDAGIEAETEAIECLGGSVPQTIVDAAGAWDAGVIVIGTHGRSGWRRVILGSVAEGVVRAADRPVLLVHHPEKKTISREQK